MANQSLLFVKIHLHREHHDFAFMPFKNVGFQEASFMLLNARALYD
jgi:hypothetical protein